MKDKQEKALVKFMASIAKTLGLVDWTVQLIEKQPDDDEAFAQITVTKYRRIASVQLCHDFETIGHKNILHVLIHELLHLYFVDTKALTEDLFDSHVLGVESFNVLIGALHSHEEIAVDRMASAWADIMWDWESVQKALRKITPQVERTAS